MKTTIWEKTCIVHVGAVIHNHQWVGASWSRKCLWWKDCPGDLTSLDTDNVNFCKRSCPYQREASRPSSPGRFFKVLFSQPPTPRQGAGSPNLERVKLLCEHGIHNSIYNLPLRLLTSLLAGWPSEVLKIGLGVCSRSPNQPPPKPTHS